VSSLSRIYNAPPLDVAYRLASHDWCYVFTQVHGQQRLLVSAHAGAAENLNAANQGISNGHKLYRTSLNPICPAWDYTPVHHVHRNYLKQEISSVEHGICPIAEFTSPLLNCAHSNRILYPLFC